MTKKRENSKLLTSRMGKGGEKNEEIKPLGKVKTAYDLPENKGKSALEMRIWINKHGTYL